MADELQTTINVLTRDEHAKAYLKSYKLRAPAGVDIGPKSQPDVEARADADVAMVLYADAQSIAQGKVIIGATGEDLLRKAEAAGIEGKLPATGASGWVTIAASDTGGSIVEGRVLTHTQTKSRYQVTVGGTYFSGNLCPVTGIDTGTSTNLPIGSVLEWDEAPPGILPTAIVADDGEGDGLTGGRPEETDEELVQRIIEMRRDPATAGNAAEYRQAARKTPTLSIEQVFSYEAPFGPGTVAIVAMMRPAYPGASRAPNLVHLAAIDAKIRNSGFPGDDGPFVCSLIEVPVDVHIGVQWTRAATGFSDQAVWPPYVAASPVRVSAATSATSFTLETSVTIASPKIGQTLAFYNGATRRFVRKRVLTVTEVTAGKKWTITCETVATASDTSFVPRADLPAVPGQVVSPWSDSLNMLVTPMLTYFGQLGPGEMVHLFWDEGTRQKRQPESPELWPHVISSRDLANAPPKAIVSDVVPYQPASNGTSYSTPVGLTGSLVYLLTLGDFAVFAKG